MFGRSDPGAQLAKEEKRRAAAETKAEARKAAEEAKAAARLAKMQKAAELAEEKKKNREEARAKAEQQHVKNREYRLRLFNVITNKIGKLLEPILEIIKILLRELAPYIALVLIILLIIWAFSSSGSSSSKGSKSSSYSGGWWPKWLTPNYKFKQLFNYFNTKINSTARPKEAGGRCDNLNFSDKMGLCPRTYAPEETKWTIDVDKIPELNKLPDDLFKKYTNNSEKLIVYIPWAPQGTFYVPQCGKAYFKVTNSKGIETTANADYLFKDNGLTCDRVTKTSTSYGSKYRPRDATDKQDYASEKDPKCIHQL